METIYDVIILGAGAAGLYAGHLLSQYSHQQEYSQKELRFLILEARNRIGGRIHTVYPDPECDPVEMGAELVHGLPLQMKELLANFDGRLICRSENIFIYDNDLTLLQFPTPTSAETDKNNDFTKRRLLLDLLLMKTETAQKTHADKSAAEFFRSLQQNAFPDLQSYQEREKYIRYAENYIEGYHAADVEKISALALAQIERSSVKEDAVSGAYLLEEGYQHFFYRISFPFRDRIQLNSPVKSIRWQPGRVELEVDSSHESTDLTSDVRLENNHPKIFKARKILCTAPIGVLKNSKVLKFEPSLPDKKLQALEYLQMGHALKIVLRFHSLHSRQLLAAVNSSSRSRSRSSNNTLPANWSILFNESKTQSPLFRVWWPRGDNLIGWSGGEKSFQQWQHMSKDQIIEKAITELSSIFKIDIARIKDDLIEPYIHNWTEDKYSQGAYPYITVGGLEAPTEISQPVENTLFFAGDGTEISGFSGTVNGALISSAQATQQILKCI